MLKVWLCLRIIRGITRPCSPISRVFLPVYMLASMYIYILERIVNLLLFQKRVFSSPMPFEYLVEIKFKYYDIDYLENNRDKFIPR